MSSPPKVGKEMSGLQPGGMEGSTGVLTTNAVLRLMATGGLNRDTEIMIHKHTKQIELLKKEIEEKNDAYLKLHTKLKDLEKQKNELQFDLNAKNKETEDLKEKISKLESEKKDLEKKLRSLESELEAMREEVAELKEANKISKEKNASLDMKVKKLSMKVDGMSKDLEESISENATLKKKVKGLEEVQNMASAGIHEGMSLPSLLAAVDPVEKALLVLGELCWRIQGMMYQKVFPNLFDNRKSYKVKHIEEDIEELDDERKKNEAKGKWVALKKKLNWKKTKHARAMKSIQEKRNDTAHPDVNEEQLVWSAKVMEQSGKLTGWHSAETVNELIEMWKQLVQPE